MATYQIENEFLTITFNDKGAEILTIYGKQTQLNYMWDANPAFWPKTSPVLFPIVGGLKNNTYEHIGNRYTLTRHGFARDNVFEVTKQTDTSITFTLVSSEHTKTLYPFDFRFSVIHELKENKLSVTYLVENTDKVTLPFSVGAHPAFKVPFVEGTVFEDYYLQFNHTETAHQWPIGADGLIENNPKPFLTNTNQLPLTKSLFYNDAIVTKDLESTAISILSSKTPHGIRMEFIGFPYMGIWQAKDADFLCIEPWFGIGDVAESSYDIEDKEGILHLPIEQSFEATWSVTLF